VEVWLGEIDGVTKAVLEGRLDTAGVNHGEIRFTAGIVPCGRPAVVDMRNVSFVGSLAIRMLLSTARSLNRKGAKFAMFGANTAVLEILETSGVSDILLIVGTEGEALLAVSA
jgi:anti-sigma B factor antagonist